MFEHLFSCFNVAKDEWIIITTEHWQRNRSAQSILNYFAFVLERGGEVMDEIFHITSLITENSDAKNLLYVPLYISDPYMSDFF